MSKIHEALDSILVPQKGKRKEKRRKKEKIYIKDKTKLFMGKYAVDFSYNS